MISMTWPQYKRRECTVRVHLSPHQNDLLAALLVRYPLPLSVNDLIEAVYPHPDFEPEQANREIVRQVSRLRRKGIRIAHDRRGYRLIQCAADLRRAA